MVLSHHNIINNANIAANYVINESKDNVIILPLPLFHSFSLTCGAQVMAVKGLKTVLTGYRFNVKEVVDSIVKYDGSFLMATPTMIIDILDYVKKNNIQVPSLTTILTGAASFPPELEKTIKETIPHFEDLRIGYGLTESSPTCSLSKATDSQIKKITTVGRVIEYVEVKIVDPITDQTVEHDKEGELLIRGHNVMIEYFEDSEKTKEAITPTKWLKTGDRATMDKEGFIKICGRTKEMIIKGGN